MVRFIHTADLHLDQPFKQIYGQDEALHDKLASATYESFDNLITTAINEKVDFMVIVGDIYDQSPPSLKAQFAFKAGMERLAEAHIEVLVTYGNHDFLASDKNRLALPKNVHVFGERVSSLKVTTQTGETVAVTGFSYGKRWVDEDMSQQYPSRYQEYDYHIGLLHGAPTHFGNSQHYAPFEVSHLRALNYDYWALGHIHARQSLNEEPPMLYPGNIQGSKFKEAGPKGAYLVTLEKHQVAQAEFFETTDWQFRKKKQGLPKLRSLEDLRQAVEEALHVEVMRAKNENINTVVELVFTCSGDEESLYWWDNYHESLLEQLQWSLNNQAAYRRQEVYFLRLSLELAEDFTWTLSPDFSKAISAAFRTLAEEEVFNAVAKPLTEQAEWQRLIAQDLNRADFKADALKRAEALLATQKLQHEA